MLNPKLRELYSETVIPILETLASELEPINKNLTVVGVVECEYGGLVCPDGFFYTGNDRELYFMLLRVASKISESVPGLTDEEYDAIDVVQVVPEPTWRAIDGEIPEGYDLWVR